MKKIAITVLIVMLAIILCGSSFLLFGNKNGNANEDEEQVIDFSDITISCLGDSLTYATKISDSYPKTLQQQLGAKMCYNYGIGGSTCGVVTECECHPDYPGRHLPMCQRYKQIKSESDIIIVMCGVNDAAYVPLGTIDDTINTTFYGAMNILCKGLLDRYKDSYVFFMTSFEYNHYDIANTVNSFGAHPKDYYFTAVKEVCAKYDIDVFDTFTEIDFDSVRDTVGDKVHPNQEFVTNVWVPAIADFIRTNYKGK